MCSNRKFPRTWKWISWELSMSWYYFDKMAVDIMPDLYLNNYVCDYNMKELSSQRTVSIFIDPFTAIFSWVFFAASIWFNLLPPAYIDPWTLKKNPLTSIKLILLNTWVACASHSSFNMAEVFLKKKKIQNIIMKWFLLLVTIF